MRFSLKQLLLVVALCCLQTAFVCNVIDNWDVVIAGVNEIPNPTLQGAYYTGINGALLVASFLGSVYCVRRIMSR